MRTTSGWSNSGWCAGRFGVEDVQPDTAEPAGPQRRVDGVDVDQAPAAAVDQDRPGFGTCRSSSAPIRWRVESSSGRCRVITSLRRHSSARSPQRTSAGGAADRVVGQHRHAQGGAEGAGALTDPAVADDAEGGAGEVADRDGAAVGPSAGADQGGQPAEPLDQVHGHRDGALGDRGGAGARGDHDGDAAGGGGVQVDPSRPRRRSGRRPAAAGVRARKSVSTSGIGPDDRALRLRAGRRRSGSGDEPAAPVEHRAHQLRDRPTPSPTTSGRSALRHCRTAPSVRGRRWRPATCGDLLPLAVLGGGGGRRDHLGVGEGLLDGGVALLAAGHGDQELLGLDDLEVVVAHAVARARLECGVVALGGVAQDGGVALVGAGAADRQLQLVHLLEVPATRSPRCRRSRSPSPHCGPTITRDASRVPTAPAPGESAANRTRAAA